MVSANFTPYADAALRSMYNCPAVGSRPDWPHTVTGPWETGSVAALEINECAYCKATMYRLSANRDMRPFTFQFIIHEEEELW